MGDITIESLTPIIFLVVIFAVFYLFMIRPRQKQQKAHEEIMKELRRGDKVITSGGIYGQIESASEEIVILKIESGAMMKVARSNILGKQSGKQIVGKSK